MRARKKASIPANTAVRFSAPLGTWARQEPAPEAGLGIGATNRRCSGRLRKPPRKSERIRQGAYNERKVREKAMKLPVMEGQGINSIGIKNKGV
jgi:hypothetical protein